MPRLSTISLVALSLFAPLAFAQDRDKPAVAPMPVKFWVERLEHADPNVRRRAANFLINETRVFGLSVLGYFYVDATKMRARDVFRNEAKALAPLLPSLLTSKDEDVVGAAVTLLMALGPEAKAMLPDLQRIVLDNNAAYFTRRMCFYALLFVTPEDQPVGPMLLKFLDSLPQDVLPKSSGGDEKCRGDMVGAEIPIFVVPLMTSGHTKIEVPYLVKIAAGDYDPTFRALAVGMLGSLEFDAKSAVPALRKLLKDDDGLVRVWAAGSLLAIEQDPKLVPELIEVLKLQGKGREEFEKGMRRYFEQLEREKESRREMGENESDEKLQDLRLKTFLYGSGYTRWQTIYRLSMMEPAAKSAIPEPRKALPDPDEDTRLMAAEALKQIEPAAAKPGGK